MGSLLEFGRHVEVEVEVEAKVVEGGESMYRCMFHRRILSASTFQDTVYYYYAAH